MKKMKISSGMALDGGVMFASKKYFVIAKYPKENPFDGLEDKHPKKLDENGLEIITGKVDPPVGGKILNSIPFLAGIVSLLGGLISQNNREPCKTVKGTNNSPAFTRIGVILLTCGIVAIMAGCSYLIGSWLAGMFGVVEGTFWYGFLLSLMLSFICFAFPVGAAHFLQGDLLNFHGAEHKVGNALRKNLELTKENVHTCSKFHIDCSTNLLVNNSIIYPFIAAFLYVWLGSFPLTILVSMIGTELWRISTWIGKNFLGYMFNCFGILTQKITVRDPEDRHVIAAITAMNKLLEMEQKNE